MSRAAPLLLLGGAALGWALGRAYFALLALHVAAALEGGDRRRLARAAARVPLAAGGLWVCAQGGAPALLAALGGFLAARAAAVRRAREALV